MGNYAHAEGVDLACECAADVAESEDADSFAPDLRAGFPGPELSPAACAGSGVELVEPSGQVEHQREGMVGDLLGGRAGGIADDDAGVRGCVQIDAFVAVAEADDELAVGERLDDRRRHGEAAVEHHVGAGDGFDHLAFGVDRDGDQIDVQAGELIGFVSGVDALVFLDYDDADFCHFFFLSQPRGKG